MYNLTDLSLEQTAKIVKIDADVDTSRRMVAMGLRPGCTVRLLRSAPFNGPMHLRVCQTELVIRQVDAKMVIITDASMLTYQP